MGGVTCRCLGNHGATLLKHPFALIAHRPIRSCVRMLCYSWMCVSVVRVLHAFIHVYIYIQKRHLPSSTYQIYKTRTYTIHFFTVTRFLSTLYVCETIHNHWHITAHEINYRSLENISSFADLSPIFYREFLLLYRIYRWIIYILIKLLKYIVCCNRVI